MVKGEVRCVINEEIEVERERERERKEAEGRKSDGVRVSRFSKLVRHCDWPVL